jgi:hypothetical protein
VAEGPRDGGLPAYVNNGLTGLRVGEVPLITGMVLVSGLAGEYPERQIEPAAAPYPLAGDLVERRLDERPALDDHRSAPELVFRLRGVVLAVPLHRHRTDTLSRSADLRQPGRARDRGS